jgi:uncharacterized cupredoxin-like copper-binding protein
MDARRERTFRSPVVVRSVLRAVLAASVTLSVAVLLGACDAGVGERTPLPIAGTPDHPRDVNIIAREYAFTPPTVDFVPGETVRIHVVNAGLDIHEAIIGNAATQDAWETAEAAVAGAPPGPTPLVSVPPGVAGVRVVVPSGARVDVLWTVPLDLNGFIVGCHIPGHYAQGMHVPVRAAP